MVEDVLKEVLRLAVGAGLPLTVTLLLILGAAVLLVVGKRLGGVKWTRTSSEPPLTPGAPVGTGEGGTVMDGNGNPVTTGEPGGGPTGGMG